MQMMMVVASRVLHARLVGSAVARETHCVMVHGGNGAHGYHDLPSVTDKFK